MSFIINLLLALLVVAAIIIIPFAGIWALNTLFALAIAYTWKTWLAALILILIISQSYPDRDND